MTDYRVTKPSSPTSLDSIVGAGPSATHYVDSGATQKLYSKPIGQGLRGARTFGNVTVPNFTNVAVIEENVGPNNDFHKVYLVVYSDSANYTQLKNYTISYKTRERISSDQDRGEELFLPAMALKKFDDVDQIPEVLLPDPGTNPPGEDWRTHDVPVIWNQKTNEYWVTTSELGNPDELVPDSWSDMSAGRIEEIKKKALIELLYFLGFSDDDVSGNYDVIGLLSKTTPEQKKCYIPREPSEHAEAPGFYKDVNRLKWLVIIKGGIIEAMPRKPFNFSNTVDASSSPLRTIMKMSDLPKFVETVATTLDTIHSKNSSGYPYPIDLGDFNPKEEAKRLRKVPKAVTDLLALDPNLNIDAGDFNSTAGKDKFIEFGFSSDYKITYILVTRRLEETNKVTEKIKEKVVPLVTWTTAMNEKFVITNTQGTAITFLERTSEDDDGWRKPGGLVSVQDPWYRKWYKAKNGKYPDKETIKEIERDRYVTTSEDTGEYTSEGPEGDKKIRMTPVKVGMNKVMTGAFHPLESPRTAAFLYYLVPMNDDAKKVTPGNWVDYVHAYTYPKPDIHPSFNPEEEELVSGKFMGMDVSVVKKKQEEEPDEYDRIQEMLDDPALKEHLATRRDSVSDFIGDLQLQDLPTWLEMNTTRWDLDTFPELLHKIPPAHLINIAISCLAPNTTLNDLLNALCKAALDELPDKLVAQLVIMLDSGYRQSIIDKLGPTYIKNWIDTNIQPKSGILAEECRKIFKSEIEDKLINPAKERVGPTMQEGIEDFGPELAEEAYFYYNPNGKPNPGDEDNPGEFMRAAILDSVDSENLCFLLAGLVKELWELLKQLLGLLSMIKHISFNVDLDLPIDDIMEWIYKMLKQMMIVLIWETIMFMLKFIIQRIIEGCAALRCKLDPSCSEGSDNINNHLRDDPIAFAKGLDVARRFGIPTDLTGDFGGIPYEDFAKKEGSLKADWKTLADFLDACEEFLTLGEYCNLLTGAASKGTLMKCRDFLATTDGYSKVYENLYDMAKISDFFVALGKIIDTSVCNIIPSFVNQSRNVRDLCKDVYDAMPTDDTLSGQADQRDSDKIKDTIKDLAKLFMKDDFSDLLPPVSCADAAQRGKSTKPASLFPTFDAQKALVPRTPPSMELLNNRVIDSTFEAVQMFFNTELLGFKNGLLESEIIQVSKVPDDIRLEAWQADLLVPGVPLYGFQRAHWSPGSLSAEKRGYFSDYDLNKDIEYWVDVYGDAENMDDFNHILPPKTLKHHKARAQIIGPYLDGPNSADGSASPTEYLKPVHPDNQRDKTVLYVARDFKQIFDDDPRNHISITKGQNVSKFELSNPLFGKIPRVETKIKQITSDEINPPVLKWDINTSTGDTYSVQKQYNFSSTIVDNYFSSVRTSHPNRDIFWKMMEKSANKYGQDSVTQIFDAGEPSNANLRWYFNKELYNNLVNSMYVNMMNNISKSIYFDPHIFNTWNIIPNPEAAGGIKPKIDLLGRDAIKDLIKEKHDSEPCQTKIDDQHPMEKAISLGVVVMLMRLFIVEYALENMFMASTYFNAKHFMKSESFVSFIHDKIEEGIDRFGYYYERMRDEIYEDVIKKVGAGRDLIDPWTKSEIILGHTIDADLETIKNHAVQLLIKAQIVDIADNIDKLMVRGSVVNDVGEIEEAYLYGLPMLDPPKKEGDVRFSTITVQEGAGQDNIILNTLDDTVHGVIELYSPDIITSDVGPYVEGQFILERYIRIGGTILTENDTKELFDRINFDDNGVVNLDTWAQWLIDNKDETPIKNKLISNLFSAKNPDTNETTPGWSFGIRLSYIPPLKNDNFNFTMKKEDILTGVIPGQGFSESYLAAFNTSTGKVSEAYEEGDHASIFENTHTDFENKLFEAYKLSDLYNEGEYNFHGEIGSSTSGRKEKAWQLKEKIPYYPGSWIEQNGAAMGEFFSGEKGEAEQNIYVFPISYAEIPFVEAYKTYRKETNPDLPTPDDYGLGKMKNINSKAGLEIKSLENGSLHEIFKIGAKPLVQKLLQNEKTQLMFKYAIPLPEIASSQSIYNMLNLRKQYKLEKTFDETKVQLLHIWKLTNDQPATTPYWSYKSGALTAEQNDNQAKNSQTTDGPKSSEIASQMAKMTVPMIIRGLAEQIDPCIRSMKAQDVEMDWGSIFPAGNVTPITFFGIFPFGFGTWMPITPLGIAALSMPKPGEGQSTLGSGEDSMFNVNGQNATAPPAEDFDENEYITNAGWTDWNK